MAITPEASADARPVLSPDLERRHLVSLWESPPGSWHASLNPKRFLTSSPGPTSRRWPSTRRSWSPHRARRGTPGVAVANPGLGGKGAATSTWWAGVQIRLPGEIAPAHWHSPAAMESINPDTGGPVLPTMTCWIQLIRSGMQTKAHRQTSSAVYHVFWPALGPYRTQSSEAHDGHQPITGELHP